MSIYFPMNIPGAVDDPWAYWLRTSAFELTPGRDRTGDVTPSGIPYTPQYQTIFQWPGDPYPNNIGRGPGIALVPVYKDCVENWNSPPYTDYSFTNLYNPADFIPSLFKWHYESYRYVSRRNLSKYIGDVSIPGPYNQSATITPTPQYSRSPYNVGLGVIQMGDDPLNIGIRLNVFGQCLMDHIPVPGEKLSVPGSTVTDPTFGSGNPGSLLRSPNYISPIPSGDKSVTVSYNGDAAWIIDGDVFCEAAFGASNDLGGSNGTLPGGGTKPTTYYVTYVGYIWCTTYNDTLIAPRKIPSGSDPASVQFNSTQTDQSSYLNYHDPFPMIYRFDLPNLPGVGTVPYVGDILQDQTAAFAPEWSPTMPYSNFPGGSIVTYQGNTWEVWSKETLDSHGNTISQVYPTVGTPPGVTEGEWREFLFGVDAAPAGLVPPIVRADPKLEVTSYDVYLAEQYSVPFVNGTFPYQGNQIPYVTNGLSYTPYNYIHVSPPTLILYLVDLYE